MEVETNVSNYFEDDEYEHIRPIARLFRNTELIGTKFNSEIQGHFVDEEFIAAIYWSNNDVDTLVDKKIEIPVSNTVVATFCKYLETNAIMDDINEENLEEILKIAKWFHYEELKSVVFNWMLINLSHDNALKFYSLNKQYSIGEMSTFQMFILKNFKSLNQSSNGFPEIPKATLDAWLGNDNLGIKDEDLFEIINGWGKHRISLMVHVRFCKMSETYLKEKVINGDNVKDYPRTVCTVVDKWRRYSLRKRRCSHHNSRNPFEFVLAVGGWCSLHTANVGEGPTNRIEVFNNRKNEWIVSSKKMPGTVKRAYHGMGVINETVYIFGGFQRRMNHGQSEGYYASETYAYTPRLGAWRQLRSMISSRCYVSSAVNLGLLYALGGFNGSHRLRSAEVYDHITNEWQAIPSMTLIRSDGCAVAYRGKVFSIGGIDGDQIHSSVEIYNPVNNTWTFGPPLNIGRSGVKAIVYHDKIYVIGGYDGNQRLKTVEVFDGNTWTLLESKMNLRRSNFAVTILDDQIMVMGGFQGAVVTQESEVYNDVHDIWIKIKALNFERSALAAVTMNHYLLSMKHFQ